MVERCPVVGWNEKARCAVEVEVDPAHVRERLKLTMGEMPEEALDGQYREIPAKDPAIPAVGRWAAVVLKPDLKAARRALRPLLEARQKVSWSGNGTEPGLLVIERPDTDVNAERWVKRLRETAGKTMPHNLLLVGGPDRIPFEIQRGLDEVFVTGRLDAGAADGAMDWAACAAYAEKIRRYEAGEVKVGRNALLYSFATDPATGAAHASLSTPLWEYLLKPAADKGWNAVPDPPVRLFAEAATAAALKAALAGTAPAVVFTASHGVEDPLEAANWGALTDATCVGAAGSTLSANSIPRDAPFAEGSVFFTFACHSAGVPATSLYSPLAGGSAPSIKRAPLTAPLPRALLAHPRGPIGFIGHVDRVTNECFADSVFGEGLQPFVEFFDWSLGGVGTLGQALGGFRKRGLQTLTRLLKPLRNPEKTMTDSELIKCWKTYNDYLGFILLGDPALRLSL